MCLLSAGSSITICRPNWKAGWVSGTWLSGGTNYHAMWRYPMLATPWDVNGLWVSEVGAITAACFLAKFTDGLRWAHLDIAGMAWSSKGDSTTPKGATAYGVRLLDTWIADNYEK